MSLHNHDEDAAIKAICPTCHVHDHRPLKFPRGFLWGTGASAHQVEGNNTNNDWWAWEQEGGHIINNDVSNLATDQYHRFEEDFDLAKKYFQNTHRLSIEWSRIEPQPGRFNARAFDHYEQVLLALRKRHIKPMVTLHHFTNPQWFAARGGWERADAPALFARYVERVARRYGKLVDFWITINEPHVYASNGYITGEWPPQKKSYWRAWVVLRHLARAHVNAYRIIHRLAPRGHKPQVGFAHNYVAFANYGVRFFDYLYEWLINYVWNVWFFKKTPNTHDFIGLNYYFYHRVRQYTTPRNSADIITAAESDRDVTDTGWEIYPGGIFRALLELSHRNLPIYITENGLAAVNDDRRSRFIVAHLKEIYHAIKAGADVRGYYHWSLTDNFEWAKGFAPRFGLIAIDYANDRARIPRPSANVYARICKENAINHDLLRFLGHDVPTEPPVI